MSGALGKVVSATLAAALLGGMTTQAAAEERPPQKTDLARLLSALGELPPPEAPRRAPTRLEAMSAASDRQLVEDFAEFDEEEEVRAAARAALESTDPNAIRDFLERGEAEARQRAKDKQGATDVANRQKIESLRGTGGPFFNAEVERVLKGTARDRADFLAFGAEIARQRDAATEQNEKERAAENRKRVEMLAAVGGPAVKAAAQQALAAGDDKVIEEFLAHGYLVAARKDSADQAAHEKAQQEALAEAARLRKLAENTARAAAARTKLITAHGSAVKGLKEASNAMSAAASQSRLADRMLAADKAGKRVSDYGPVKAEIARQVDNARGAAKAAQVAAGLAKVQADVLVETGLTHGVQWSDIATGIAGAADAAVKAAETAQHAVDATAADAAGLNAQNQAELHAQQATKWRANAQQHAAAAARLAAAAAQQAKIATDAATKSRQARVEAEQAEKQAWAHAQKTRDARIEAQRQARIAAEQRAIAEKERELAAAARVRAEQERDRPRQRGPERRPSSARRPHGAPMRRPRRRSPPRSVPPRRLRKGSRPGPTRTRAVRRARRVPRGTSPRRRNGCTVRRIRGRVPPRPTRPR